MKHTVDLVAWVLWSVFESVTHEPSADWLNPGSLEDVLSSGASYQDAVPAKDELEHGVRDLACAGLVSVTGNKFAITESGRAISKAAWAEYDAKPRGNFLGDKLAKRLKKIPCCADVGGWSVTQQDYDAAVAAYRAYFHEASKKADVMLAAWREEQAQHPESVKQGKVRDVVIITLKLFAYLGIGLVAAALLFFVITALGGYQ